MYVCICNALTDSDIKTAARDGANRPAEVFAACRCRAQCGTCVRAVCTILGFKSAPDATMQDAAALA